MPGDGCWLGSGSRQFRGAGHGARRERSPRRYPVGCDDACNGRSYDISSATEEPIHCKDSGHSAHCQGSELRPAPLCRIGCRRNSIQALRPSYAFDAGLTSSGLEPYPLGDFMADIHSSHAAPEEVTGKLHDLLATLWSRSQQSITDRLDVLRTALRTLRTNPAEKNARRGGADAAHKLAGILGTFGLPEGTNLARRIEVMLEAPAP